MIQGDLAKIFGYNAIRAKAFDSDNGNLLIF